MNVNGRHYRTIWLNPDGWAVDIIDQTKFPHLFEVVTLRTPDEAAHAIRDMLVRGAPLIGVTAAFGMALAMRQDPSDTALAGGYDLLVKTRPTAINIRLPVIISAKTPPRALMQVTSMIPQTAATR